MDANKNRKMSVLIYMVLFGLLFDVGSADDPQRPLITAPATIENILPDAYNSLMISGRLNLIKQATGTYTPGPMVDPTTDPCASSFSVWYSVNYPYFQSLANMQCISYRGIYRSRSCSIAFQVNPQNPPCNRWQPYPYASLISIPEHLDLNERQ